MYMSLKYLVITIILIVLALITARRIILRWIIATLLVVLGFICISMQGAILLRTGYPMDSPSSEFKAGFEDAIKKVQQQWPMLSFTLLSMFILAMFPLRGRRIRHKENVKEQECPPDQNSIPH